MTASDEHDLGFPGGRRDEAWLKVTTYSGLAIAGAAVWSILVSAPADFRLVLMPVFAAAWVFAVFTSALYFYDNQSPIFNVGFFAAGTALVYVALPPLFFAISGFEWSASSDNRLVLLAASQEDVSDYAWRGALYLSGFCLAYVFMTRGLAKPPRTSLVRLARSDAAVCILIIAACFLYRVAVNSAFGISISDKNELFPADGVDPHLPLVVAQVTHNIMAVQRIAKIGLIVVLLGFWKENWAKLALAGFLSLELIDTLVLFGPRSYLAALLLATLLAYHKMVRPVSMPVLGAWMGAFLAGLVAYGNIRNFADMAPDFSTANEFQSLMGTALHVREMVRSGLQVPPAVIWSELLMLVPQQLLPVEKIDPSIWYLLESGYSESGSGYMFGVQSQAEVGWGNSELFLRGVVLAFVLGLLHRQYSKHSTNFLVVVSYIWLLTVVYYSYRAATFYWLTFVPFRLLVFVAVFITVRRLLFGRAADQPDPA